MINLRVAAAGPSHSCPLVPDSSFREKENLEMESIQFPLGFLHHPGRLSIDRGSTMS